MTATERGRRSDALYYGSVSRRELCDKITFLESRIEELEALVRKLKGEGDERG